MKNVDRFIVIKMSPAEVILPYPENRCMDIKFHCIDHLINKKTCFSLNKVISNNYLCQTLNVVSPPSNDNWESLAIVRVVFRPH